MHHGSAFHGLMALNSKAAKTKYIYARFSTARQNVVKSLENLHVSLHRNESKQNFNIWVYGEKGNLKRGIGIFVP